MRRWADLFPTILALSLLYILGSTWVIRLEFPYDLEWMEGGSLVHAWRLREGLALYPPPDAGFIPYIYPPAYSAILATLGDLVALDYFLARALSLGGIVAAALALPALFWRRDRALGMLLGAIFLGTYAASGTFFDLARGDSLMTAALVWSFALAADGRRGTAVASGLALAAAFAFKQSTALFGIPIALALFARGGWREAARFVAPSALPALLLTAAWEYASNGFFLKYTLGVPATHPVNGWRIFLSTPSELAGALPVAVVALALGAEAPWRRRLIGALVGGAIGALIPQIPGVPSVVAWRLALAFAALGAALPAVWQGSRRAPLLWGLGLALLLYGALMRGHHGGFINVYMPVHWGLIAGMGLVMARWRRHPQGAALSALALALQLALQLWATDPTRWTPTEADRAAGEALVARVAQIEGAVWAPYHAWVPVQAGKMPDGPHLIALWDVDHPQSPLREGAEAVKEALASHRWSAVLTTRRFDEYGLSEHYDPALPLSSPANTLDTRTGWRARPYALWTPKWQPGPPPPDLVRAEGAPLDRERYHLTARWDALELKDNLRYLGTSASPEALTGGLKGRRRVWLRAGASAAVTPLREAIPALTRAGLQQLDAEVRNTLGESAVIEVPIGGRPLPGEAGGLVRAVRWPDGRVVLSPVGAPKSAALTTDLDGMNLIFSLSGGLPPRMAFAAVPADFSWEEALAHWQATDALAPLTGASLVVAPPWEAGKVAPERDLRAFAHGLAAWESKPIQRPH